MLFRSCRVLAPPNPLRGLADDAAAVSAVADAIDGPVVLVGHSYGGAVITQASAALGNVVGLVYLAAFSRWPVLRPGAIPLPYSTRYAPSRFAARLLSHTARGHQQDHLGRSGLDLRRWAAPPSHGNVGAAPWSQVPGRGDAPYSSGAGAGN